MADNRDLIGLPRLHRWLLSEDRKQYAWSVIPLESEIAGKKRSGDSGGEGGIGASSGRALAEINDRDVWGLLAFLSCDAFPARFDAKTGDVFAVEGKGDKDTPGLAPWRMKGAKPNIRRARGVEGVVVRGNQVGAEYPNAHVWLRNGELVAHHRKTADSADPPLNSTPVHDPGEGSDDWEAGLHGIMRVRAFPEAFCGGSTAVPGEDKFRALLLNFTKSTGDNSGWGSVTFSDHEGLLSYEAFGPLTYGAPKHRVGEVDGRETRQAAIDIDRALFGDRTDAWTAPLLFDRAAWKSGGGRFITDAFIRMDFGDTHQGHCGVKPGKWKPEARCHWNWLPPTHPKLPPTDDPPTDDPPIDGPPPPGEPGRPVIDPGPIPGRGTPTHDFDPTHASEDSTVNTPDEIQIPSEYGHAKPALPDADEQSMGEPRGADPEGMSVTHGYTYAQALASNVVSHEVFIPQFLYETERSGAGADPNARWPQKTSRPAEVTLDSDGRVVAYKRGYGPGTKVKLAGNARAWHALYALKARWPSSFDEHGYLIAAGKNAAGVEMAGWLGIGLRAKTTLKPASGWYLKLDYTDGHDVPDLDIRSTDSAGLDASTGRVVKINGTAITGVSGNEVTAAATLTQDRLITGDGSKTAKTTSIVTGTGAQTDLSGIGNISRSGAILEKQQVRAYAGGSTSVSAASWTQIAFDGETFDVDSVFASDTFTASVTCKLRVTAQVITDIRYASVYLPDPDNNAIGIAIYKNGSLFSEGHAVQILYSGTVYVAGHISDELTLAANDTVKIYFYSVAGCNAGGKGSGVDYVTFERVD